MESDSASSPEPPPVSSGASAPDHRALLAYSRRRAADTIKGYAGIGRALFGSERGELSDRERALMTSLLRKLVADAETAIMRALAEGRRSDAALVRGLEPRADTYERIAATEMLRDQTLIEAVRHRIGEFHLESAIRKRQGGRWSDADAGDDAGTVAVLAGGAGQSVRDRLNDSLAMRPVRLDGYENPLLPLTELDGEAVRRLFWNVAAILRQSHSSQSQTGQSKIGESEIDTALEQAALNALADLDGENPRTSRAAVAADALADAGRLDAALVVEAMRRGEVQLSVAMFCRLTGLRRSLAYRLMLEAGGTGLAIACRAVDMASADFGDFYLLTRNAQHAGGGGGGGDEFGNVMSWFDRLDRAEAEKVAAYWRRSAAYLHALWLQDRAETGDARPH